MGRETGSRTRTCAQCGECCRWLVLGEIAELDEDERRYYGLRGAIEGQGLLLLEHPCTKLEYVPDDDGIVKGRCGVHGEKPDMCRQYDGRRRDRGTVFFIPEGCAMARGRKKQG